MKKWIIRILNIICFILIITTKSDVTAFNSTFTVLVPKDITNECQIAFSDVNIDDYEVIKIDTPNKIQLTDQISNQKTECYINSDKDSFTKTDIENGIKTSNISVNDTNINAGQWNGNFPVDIYISDIPLEEALNDWEYTVDDNTNNIYLNKYIGTKTDIKVYGVYQLNGKIYNTVLQGYKAYRWGRYIGIIFGDDTPVTRTDVTSISFNKGVTSTIGDSMFFECRNLKNIDLTNVKFVNIKSIQDMFCECDSLESIVFGNRNDFSQVTSMHSMFKNCKSLKEIDFGTTFKPNNNTSLCCTFQGCKNLEKILNADGWNTSNVTTLEGTFADCEKLENISFVRDWNTENNTSLRSTFQNCKKLADFSSIKYWNTEKVTDMAMLFSWSWNLQEIDLSNWKTPKVKDMGSMFFNSRIESIDLTNFDTSNVISMSNMFNSCGYLETVNMANLDVSNITSFDGMFCYGYKIKSIDITGWNAPQCKSVGIMFFSNRSLTDLKGIETLLQRDEYVTTNIRCCFSEVPTSTLDLSKWKLKTTDNIYYTFYNCKNLKSLDLSGFDTSNVTNMSRLFQRCESLEEIKGIENWDVSKVKSFGYMFDSCFNLKSLDLSKWNTVSATNRSNTEGGFNGFERMFINCKGLTYLNLSNFTNNNGATCVEMIAGCWSLNGVDLDMSKFNFRDAKHITIKNGEEVESSGITNIFLSTTVNLYVNADDYEIMQQEIENERTYGANAGEPDIIYTIVNKKDQ